MTAHVLLDDKTLVCIYYFDSNTSIYYNLQSRYGPTFPREAILRHNISCYNSPRVVKPDSQCVKPYADQLFSYIFAMVNIYSYSGR